MVEDKKLKKFDFEIQVWLGCPPRTLSRLRKFYDSMVSIHLGGEGLMGQYHNKRLKGVSTEELNVDYKNYKINYPK